jgi:prevent-host-death family protein
MATGKEIKMTELRQNLPAYLARAQRGERFRVTSRGKVVAELTPPTASKAEVAEARERLRGSVLRYDRPLDPVFDPDEWDVDK